MATGSGIDRRLMPHSGSVALESLRGKVQAQAFTPGTTALVAVPVADLLDAPGGRRDRQVLMGESLTVIDRRDGHAFVQAEKDGYCGWLTGLCLAEGPAPTHWVAAPGSHLYTAPKVQAQETVGISLGTRLHVMALDGKFAQTPQGWVPSVHLRAIGDWADDAVAVAESLLGTPYLWGGNSRSGIDCSGMVQAALTACGIACPGDSDLQQAVGTPLPEGEALQRGDLLFWKGHVAMAVDADLLIHANGHRMAVTHEGIADCIARIMAQENRPVIARRRPGG